MKINNLISQTNVSFGYNAQYHKNFAKYLDSVEGDSRDLALFLKKEDALTLDIEDKIIELEKDKKDRGEQYKTLVSYLQELKSSIAYCAELFFPEMKYPSVMFDNYTQESRTHIKGKSKWRKDLAESMKSYIIIGKNNFTNKGENKAEEKNLQSGAKYKSDTLNIILSPKEPNMTLKYKQQTIADNNTDNNTDNNQLIVRYIPKSSSPRGFCDVVGMGELKEQLNDEIIDYIKNPHAAQIDLEEYGIEIAKSFLFFGPPGCGKTYMCEALAGESGLSMYKMDVSRIGSKYVNESAKNLQSAFDFLEQEAKKEGKPIILYMDEVESLVLDRDNSVRKSNEDLKTTSTMLKLIWDAYDKGIIVIASTNKYDLLDKAFVDRFKNKIYFPLPDETQINVYLKDVLSKALKGKKLAQDDECLIKLSNELKGYSLRSIKDITDNALRIAKKRNRDDVCYDDMVKAINKSEHDKIDESIYKKNNKEKIIRGFCAS